MKGPIICMCAAGAGGAFWFGTSGPDFERVLNKPPMTVYAAFSALGPEGTATLGQREMDGRPRRMTRRIEKVSGESISYEILIDDRPVVDVDLGFEPGPDGQGTRLTAEFDWDAYEIGSAYENEAGVALSMVPEGYIDHQFSLFMDDLADDIEAGRPLPALSLAGARMRPSTRDGGNSVRGRRMAIEENRRRASEPATRARPMVNPNRVARDHMNGRERDF